MISQTIQIENRSGNRLGRLYISRHARRGTSRGLPAGLLAILLTCSACLNPQPQRSADSQDDPLVQYDHDFEEPAFTDSYHLPPVQSITADSGAITVESGAGKAAQTQPAFEAPQPDRPGSAAQEPAIIVQLDGHDFLALGKAIILDDNLPVPCRLVPEQATSRPDSPGFSSFKLIPEDPRQPVCRCEVEEFPGETSLRIYSPGRSANLVLTAETLAPMLPVCLTPRESGRIMNAALGQVAGDWFDGLFAPERDWAVSVQGRVHCRELPDSVRLTFSTASGDAEEGTFIFRSLPDFLKTQHNLPGYAPLNRRRPELMPAAWMPLETGRPPAPDEIARNTVWMAINLQPYGAASVLLPGMQTMLPAVRSAAVPSVSTTAGPHPGGRATPGSTPTGISAWECFLQMATGITERFWGHGLTAQTMSSTLLIGEPLTLEQARLYASVIGLAGESPIACERMYALSEERIHLLRSIVPAATVRAVDLFAHQALPPVWNLAVANGAGQWNVLGLFNTSDEPRIESVELADLHLGSGAEQFAVYDVWERRLLRMVRDRFQIRVPATGCRVLSLIRLREDRPTIIATDRHITAGGVDLHDVRWDEQTLTLSGSSDLVGNHPYELLLYLPEGDDSLELLAIDAPGTEVRSRRHGPLRAVTFERPASGSLSWKASFCRAGQPPQSPPPRPRNLVGRQNTRGVLLGWYQPDERVVAHRIYRNQRLLAEVDGCEHQDSTAFYNAAYEYQVSAVSFSGQESSMSDPLIHVTPIPASTNLTQLVPLSASQDRLPMGKDKCVSGAPLRIGGQRIYRGIGTIAPSRMVYFLGGGYESFSGAVGIDDSARGRGSAVFRVIADGQTLFTSPLVRGGQPPVSFSLPVAGKLQLELVVSDGGDGGEFDFADWANPYLSAVRNAADATGRTETQSAHMPQFDTESRVEAADLLSEQPSVPREN